MTIQAWAAFAILVTVLSLTPGPAVLLVVSHALSAGIGRTFWVILGILAANTLYFALSAAGLGAILTASHRLFSIIRLCGAGYLILIGAFELLATNVGFSVTAIKGNFGAGLMFLRGLILQVSSPAALLFFVAVIPQFLDPNSPLVAQVILLAVTGNAAEIVILLSYAAIADRIAKILIQGRFFLVIKRISGLLLMVAGMALAAFNA
jgi:homoserine/homoserine lactone efflux protein